MPQPRPGGMPGTLDGLACRDGVAPLEAAGYRIAMRMFRDTLGPVGSGWTSERKHYLDPRYNLLSIRTRT